MVARIAVTLSSLIPNDKVFEKYYILINVTESLQLEPTKEIFCCSIRMSYLHIHIHFKTVTLRENCLWFEFTVVHGYQIAVIILCL